MSQCYSHSPVNTECPCCAASDCMDNCEVEAIPESIPSLVNQKSITSLSEHICADPLLGIPPYIWQPPE